MIHAERFGERGPELVLIHGWGMHGGLWQPLAERLARRCRLTVVDLPGHGHSPLPPGGFDLARLALAVAEAVPAPATWIGWSLGGMVALEAALTLPQRLERLVTIAALPRFCRAGDWPEAMAAETLESFARNLEGDPAATLKRFLALQVRGSDNERELLRLIQRQVAARPAPDPEALRLGLDILRHADLRPRLPALRLPAALFFGERDTLVPAAAARATAALLPRARCHLMEGAGHAPFLSHLPQFSSLLEDFIGIE